MLRKVDSNFILKDPPQFTGGKPVPGTGIGF